MAVNPFNEFVKTELPLRPILSTDGNQESVLVRRGAGPRVFESVDINEGEVVGKSGGLITSVPMTAGLVAATTHLILANSTKTITTYLNTQFISKKIIIEIHDGTNNYESFEMLIGKTSSTNFDHSIYGMIGNLNGYDVTVNNLTNSISVTATNTNNFMITLNYREIT